MKMVFGKPLAACAAATLAAASLAACSSESATTTGATQETSAGGAESVIATTNVWADVATAVLGEDVESIISDASIDPHHFEPAAKDLARVREAGTVVANGGHYDAAIYSVAEQDRIIFAVPPTTGDHSHDHAHIPDSLDELEHVWFSPAKVKEVAKQVEQRVGGSAADVTARMDAIEERLASFDHVHIAMTEPIAAPLIWGTELHDITPEAYLLATLDESEPSVNAVAEMLELIESGVLDFLVVNPQSTNNATERLAQAARDHNVPIVEMRETPPAGMNFLDYFEQVVDEIEAIVEKAEPHSHAELPHATH